MKTVNLTITLDGPIPAVTKQDIAEQGAEKLKKLEFTYSVLSETPNSFEEINQEPVSSDLDTFGDIDSAMKKAHELADKEAINYKTASFDEQRKLSTTSSSKYSVYNIDTDPHNEA